ncbi:MAG: hypothetical protein ACK419_00125, partial [Pyrinomonadaceae bacterium]
FVGEMPKAFGGTPSKIFPQIQPNPIEITLEIVEETTTKSIVRCCPTKENTKTCAGSERAKKENKNAANRQPLRNLP